MAISVPNAVLQDLQNGRDLVLGRAAMRVCRNTYHAHVDEARLSEQDFDEVSVGAVFVFCFLCL